MAAGKHKVVSLESGLLEDGKGADLTGELDRLIHERVRLGIVSALAANEELSFTGLKTLLRVSDGNLSVHARKLEDAGYILCKKTFKGRRPLTQYSITTEGRTALENYLSHMEALIDAFKRS